MEGQAPQFAVSQQFSGGQAVAPLKQPHQQATQNYPDLGYGQTGAPSSSTLHTQPSSSTVGSRTHVHRESKMLTTVSRDVELEDGRKKNAEAAKKIKDAWLYKQIRSRQNEFTHYRKVLMFTGTWNVNAKGKEEDLSAWLCADWGQNLEYAPDIVAVGFQEIVDLNAVNVAVDNKTQQRTQFWVERLRATLNAPRGGQGNPGYMLLMQRSLVGLLICVFVNVKHKERIGYVSSSSVGVGVMGMMGNKGGVSIRLQFYDSTICFVCTHLAAHRENVAGRNADYANVFQKTVFDVGEEATREAIYSGSMSHWEVGSSSVGPLDHDIVVWLGDLNYRVDETMPTEVVLQHAQNGNLDELRDLDQLNIERKAGRAFEPFEEGKLNFRPTYKYQPGTDVYDQRPDKKLRAPAWCDRILWMTQDPQLVEQLTYNSSERPNVSDHKPVYSTMRVTIKDVLRGERQRINDELMVALDRFENETLPMVTLSGDTLDFGEIRYNQTLQLPIKITNVGHVNAHFRFAPKNDETTLSRPWTSVMPPYGLLIPGDDPATIDVSITMDKKTAQLVNQGREVLDDTLILQLENGRDFFITVRAQYARSCFGMSAEELVLYSDPIRDVPLDPIKRVEKYDPSPANALCIPKELWRLVDAIYSKGLHEPDLFVESGLATEVDDIRECLDTGRPFGRYRISSYAEALAAFFVSLSSPIIPHTLFPSLEIDSQNIQSCARRFLEDLPPVHYNIFLYVMSFFREALLYRDRNGLTAAKLARYCCNCMSPQTQPSSGMNNDESSTSQRRSGMQLIILHLLETSSI